MKVYLAGPINGCTDAEAKDWRAEAKRLLDGIAEVVDPMDRDYRDYEHDAAIANTLVGQDKDAIRGCHAILAYPWKPSAGTSMELMWGYSLGVQSFVVVADPARVSPWIRAHAQAVVGSLEEAVPLIRERLERLRAIGWQ